MLQWLQLHGFVEPLLKTILKEGANGDGVKKKKSHSTLYGGFSQCTGSFDFFTLSQSLAQSAAPNCFLQSLKLLKTNVGLCNYFMKQHTGRGIFSLIVSNGGMMMEDQ